MTEYITNSYTRAVTRNYSDGSKKYCYRAVGGDIEYRAGLSDWQWIDGPAHGSQIKQVAADNNRLFVLTSDNRLYWRCVIEDSASWVIFVLKVLELAGHASWIDELVFLGFGGNFTLDGQRYPSLSSFADAYRAWTLASHDTRWNRLDRGIAGDDIVDIAVGNWNNVVVTYYALMKSGQILYLDEEPIMKGWAEVKGEHKPALSQNSRICASHSVLAVIKGSEIHWIRIDAHNPDHWPFGPFDFNWTDVWYDLPFHRRENHPGWHSVQAPASGIDEFFIDVGCGAPWPVPGPHPNPVALTFHALVEDVSEEIDAYRETHSEVGFLGNIDPNVSRSGYPFCCVIRQSSDGRYKHMLVPKSVEDEIRSSVWEDVEMNPCLGFVGNVHTKELHRPLCSRGGRMNSSHRRMYDTLEDALQDGYDGCYYCLRQHDTR